MNTDMAKVVGSCYMAKQHAIYMCPHLNVSFIHVFKSAGTSITSYLKDLCQPKLYQNQLYLISRHMSGTKLITPVKPEPGLLLLRQTAAFTFVREPVSRFVSALAELHKRNKKWVLQVEKAADVSGKALTTVAIEALFRTPFANIDEHIQPQSWLLTDCDGVAISNLTHIGVATSGLHEDVTGIL